MDAQPESQIVDAVLKAISEQRLRAGAKLGEQALSELFNCNRANVRRALASLAAKQVVELRPNRGAFVVTPSAQEARDVFQARRAIERTIARQAVRRVTDADITYLRDNIAAEAEARARRDKPTELRLSQQFHMYLARLSGNRVLERFLAELTMRSTLILGMYPSAEHSCAHCDEHDGASDKQHWPASYSINHCHRWKGAHEEDDPGHTSGQQRLGPSGQTQALEHIRRVVDDAVNSAPLLPEHDQPRRCHPFEVVPGSEDAHVLGSLPGPHAGLFSYSSYSFIIRL